MARMPSVMSHNFSQVPRAEIPRSSFDRSMARKGTFDSGLLIPCFVDEALPGDTFNLNVTFFARMATPLHPVMDNLFLTSFFFAIPLRLVWSNFQRFMGEQDNPTDSTDFLVPQMLAPSGGYAVGSIYDHFGLPILVSGLTHSSLPLRAYNLVYNQWFRDQNLQNSVTVPLVDTNDDPSLYTVLNRGKRHDYFTSSLPWPQKGPGSTIPLGTQAPIVGPAAGVVVGAHPLTGTAAPVALNALGTGSTVQMTGTAVAPSQALYADLTTATAATINQLRQAFQLQKLMERDARGGSRYTEIVRAHFNVTSPDARLQRAEYLGGGRTSINSYSVPQTGATGATGTTTPQGNLAAYATATGGGHGFTKSFTEHCIIIGLLHVGADLTYQRGLNRMWSRRTKYDFYWPALAHIGEQAVLNQEIYCDGTAADQQVWGYQERFGEYRYKPSEITGQFRSNAPQPLDTWHLSQDFGSTRPLLNANFIQDRPPVARVVAVTNQPQFIYDSFFKLRCARPMPVYGVPGNIDRF